MENYKILDFAKRAKTRRQLRFLKGKYERNLQHMKVSDSEYETAMRTWDLNTPLPKSLKA